MNQCEIVINNCKYINTIKDCYFDIILDMQLEENDFEYSSVLGISNKFINGIWSVDRFCEYLENKIILSALSHKEYESYIVELATLLRKAFERLRKVHKKTLEDNKELTEEEITDGEIGEVFLYGIMHDYYQAINLVPKIFYKQSTNDTVKGADSVHITLSNDEIGVWFGEAKFYTDIDGAINKAIESVIKFLNESYDKEISISYDCLEKEQIKNRINDAYKYSLLEYILKSENIDELKKYLHIPILILYEYGIIKSLKSIKELKDENIIDIFKNTSYKLLKKQAEELKKNNIFKYESIKFHVILLPYTDKKEIMYKFNNINYQYKWF